jgi:hypothetical protein
MSSYVCSAKHFNSVENALQILLASKTNGFSAPAAFREKFPSVYYKSDFDAIDKTVTVICNELRKLNVLTVTYQYKDHYKGRVNTEIKTATDALLKYRTEKVKLTTLGLYNALNCIEFQIETQHITDFRPLYPEEENALLFLTEMIESIGLYIIRKLPEDKTCRWEID